jgi:hypothetical protein
MTIKLESAYKHGISEIDMEFVLMFPTRIIRLREEPEKLLYLGYDMNYDILEIVTDYNLNFRQSVIIHADLITEENEKYLEGVL